MKDDGIVKKTQEAINDKVMPAAKEGLETAQELLGKGANIVGELLKDAGKKTEHAAETAGEMTKNVRKDATKVIGRTGEKLIATKNDAFAHFKKEADDRADQVAAEVAAVKAKLKKDAEEKSRDAVDFTKTKAEKLEVPQAPRKGKKVVKSAAGVAVLAAAAAGAYAYYKNRKDKDEAIKAEFSEKMKKWNEMGESELTEAEAEIPAKMHVRPTRIYRAGQNAMLGEDIIVNVAKPGEEPGEFNPDEVSESINPVEELRKKAEVTLETAGEKARQVAGTVSEKAKVAYSSASEKAREAYSVAEEKADELKEKLAEKRHEIQAQKDGFIQDNEDGLENLEEDLKEGFRDAKNAVKAEAKEVAEAAGALKDKAADKAEEIQDYSEDVIQNNKEGLEQLTEDLEGTFGDAKEAVEEKADDLLENKMESDEKDPLPEENLVENPYDLEHIAWEEDESLIMQKTENLRHKTSEGLETLKDKLLDAKEYLEERYNRMKPAEEEEAPEEFYSEEIHVTIHNRGNKDYFFSPMLIQRYNSGKRVTTPVPAHEEGTTLEQRIIKPGETYQGTVVLRKTDSDDALIMFEDMLMKNSVAVLLNDELDDLFLEEESFDLQDDLLFEGIEGDLDDYEFVDEEDLDPDLALDELDVEETEELTFDFTEEDPNH